MPGLRAWLRRNPQPARLRVRTDDDDERFIQLTDDVRNRWKAAEEAVHAARAVVVECLDKDGNILRAQELERAGAGGDDDEDAESDKRVSKAVSRERRELGDVIRSYGEQLNEAFDRGAAAANTGQENLVALVEVLTQHLSYAITNLHNVSVNLANIVADQGGEDGGGTMKDRLLENVIGLAMAKAGGGIPRPAAAANGAPAKKPGGKS